MKKSFLWIQLVAIIASCCMLFSFGRSIQVFAENEMYYRDYTFDQFYALPNEELAAIFNACNTSGEYGGQFELYFYDEEKAIALAEPDGWYLSDEKLLEFCEALGIPSEYVEFVKYYNWEVEGSDAAYEAWYDSDLQVVEEGIPLYWNFTVTLTPAYRSNDAESRKVQSILCTMLYLHPDVFVTKEVVLYGENCLNGDADGDGIVSLSDAIYLSKYVSGSVTESEYLKQVGDINCDEIVDETDVVLLMKFLVHLIDEIPYTDAE